MQHSHDRGNSFQEELSLTVKEEEENQERGEHDDHDDEREQ